MASKFFRKRYRLRKLENKLYWENQTMQFMNKVDILKDRNPRLALMYLKLATRIYHEKLNAYSKRIDIPFNKSFIAFIEKYPQKYIPLFSLEHNHN